MLVDRLLEPKSRSSLEPNLSQNGFDASATADLVAVVYVVDRAGITIFIIVVVFVNVLRSSSLTLLY